MKLAEIFTNHMVFQKGEPIVIFGSTETHGTVLVQLGEETREVFSQGEFQVTFPAFREYQLGLTMEVIFGKHRVLIQDIAIGEVFLLAGQSNIEYPLEYDQDYQEELAQFQEREIRCFTVKRREYPGHVVDWCYGGTWDTCSRETMGYMSAVGYFMGKKLNDTLDIPIGFVACNRGGSSILTWLPPESFQDNPAVTPFLQEYQDEISDLDLDSYDMLVKKQEEAINSPAFHHFQREHYSKQLSVEEFQELHSKVDSHAFLSKMGPKCMQRPSGLFESMLQPLLPFAFRGVVWYQGESDCCRHDAYFSLLSELVDSWRNTFSQELPFYIVGLPSYGASHGGSGEYFPEIRQAQLQVMEKNTGVQVICTVDTGDEEDIHPKSKKIIGERVANIFLETQYQKGKHNCPCLEKVDFHEDRVDLQFIHTDELDVHGELRDILEIFPNVPFEYEKNGNILSLHLTETVKVTSLGYCQRGCVNPALFNEKGVPIHPFIVEIT